MKGSCQAQHISLDRQCQPKLIGTIWGWGACIDILLQQLDPPVLPRLLSVSQTLKTKDISQCFCNMTGKYNNKQGNKTFVFFKDLLFGSFCFDSHKSLSRTSYYKSRVLTLQLPRWVNLAQGFYIFHKGTQTNSCYIVGNSTSHVAPSILTHRGQF